MGNASGTITRRAPVSKKGVGQGAICGVSRSWITSIGPRRADLEDFHPYVSLAVPGDGARR
jgi:hypothetical protein